MNNGPGKFYRKITVAPDWDEGLARVDLVVEAVFEDMEVKKGVFREMDRKTPEQAILATNTSTLWVTEIAGAHQAPRTVSGNPFSDSGLFNPPGRSYPGDRDVGRNPAGGGGFSA